MRFIYTKRFAIFFASLCLVAFITFLHYWGFLDVLQRGVLALPRPVNFMVQRVLGPVKGFFSHAYSLKQIVKENAELKEKIYKLQAEQVGFDKIALENIQLKKELQFVKETVLKLKPCAVIGRNSVGVVDSLTINCGREDGAEEGLAVTASGFFVGRLTYVADGFSALQLITNANFSTDAKLSKSGRLGVLRGSFNSGLIIDQISQDESLEPGMLVVSAGVNDKVPKNLLIGEIGQIFTGSNDLFKKATVISPVDFVGLEFVFLVNPGPLGVKQ